MHDHVSLPRFFNRGHIEPNVPGRLKRCPSMSPSWPLRHYVPARRGLSGVRLEGVPRSSQCWDDPLLPIQATYLTSWEAGWTWQKKARARIFALKDNWGLTVNCLLTRISYIYICVCVCVYCNYIYIIMYHMIRCIYIYIHTHVFTRDTIYSHTFIGWNLPSACHILLVISQKIKKV